MGEENTYYLMRLVMAKIEAPFCTQADRCNGGFWTIHHLVVGVPSQMVISIFVVVGQYAVEAGICLV